MRLEGLVSAEESEGIPRALSRWVMVCQEDGTEVSGLSDGTRHAMVVLPVPSHGLIWATGSRQSKPGDEGWLGVAVCPTSSFVSLMGGV